MATPSVHRVTLMCDGCGTQLGDGTVFPTPMEARAAGFVDGWRYPAALRKDGTPSQNASDVCPDCLPGWVPRPYGRRSGYIRADGTQR